ncbi:MAG: nucleotidyltransferase domain-containing protein [Rhodobacteraceae bacterium]|nr:nucleotidyltransferase domain-containing protein [Paracoccaceae bacterium]MCY4198051.1 nucleotidyltransferase domain-containing protein [Paracoccaceae bacterium]
MRPEISDRKDEITAICRRHGVARLEIFGSAARGDDFDFEASDADFLVEFLPDDSAHPLGQLFDLRDDLSNVLARPVDLVEDGVITNPYLLAAINTYKELVYAA